MATTFPSPRDKKLNQIFNSFIHGDRKLQSSQDGALFFEAACVVCNNKGASAAVELLVAGKKGIDLLRSAIRVDLKPHFLKTSVMPFLKRVAEPSVKIVGNGHFLTAILDAMLDPPTFWSALFQAHQTGELYTHQVGRPHNATCDLQVTFSWFCLEIISSQSSALESQRDDIVNMMQGPSLLEAHSMEVRVLAQRILKVLQLRKTGLVAQHEYSPGGRHDNDFPDFRSILIYPTNDEVLSKEKPFIQRSADVFDTPMTLRPSTYVDWMFRLLREDMLAELREDLQAAWGKHKRHRRPQSFSDLRLVASAKEDNMRDRRPFMLNIHCGHELAYLQKLSQAERTKLLQNTHAIFKHNCLGALCLGSTILAFGTMVKNLSALHKGHLGFQVHESNGMKNAMIALLGPQREGVKLFVVDTPTFAYEPILRRLQNLTELPLEDMLLDPAAERAEVEQTEKMTAVLHSMQEAFDEGNSVVLREASAVRLSGAQLESTINGLRNPVALIQGPPGTGKSFIGAFIVLMILTMTNRRILVLSYTNHALDQFILDLLEIGVDKTDIVRLGSKSSEETQDMRVEERLRHGNFRLPQQIWSQIMLLRSQADDIKRSIVEVEQKLGSANIKVSEILEFLELSDDGSQFWNAFQIPDSEDGYQLVLKGVNSTNPADLYLAWLKDLGLNGLGHFAALLSPDCQNIWRLPQEERLSLHSGWCDRVRSEHMDSLLELSVKLKDCQSQIDNLRDESKRNLLQHTRLICCTTTGASMFQSIIGTAKPDVIMVEEAGEILEAHIIAALSASVKQLILIGDHKQLRPKVNNYALTVEKGDGFNLNVSLFERLIRHGHHFTTLQEQHRSHPDISHFARVLAYDKLKDHPKTLKRETLQGLSSRVIFVHHEQPEQEMKDNTDRREPGSRSKRNLHEAHMVLKTIKYLSQQGYKMENMVVLTPYLGQLSLLRDELSSGFDPHLNDLDGHDLIKAGLMTQASNQANKRSLKLSTIDNYQGEESDIVIASLARSNSSGDIGFLSARERLVVLMSRARNGIILFGNMHTFLKSKKGHEHWQQYFDTLKERGWLFDGLPVYCQQHPDRRVSLSKPADFEQHCPDGGCAETCGAKLMCGIHPCERRCHRIQDHSKTQCTHRVSHTCERGHNSKVLCGAKHSACKKCAQEDKETRRRAIRDLEMEKTRQERQDKYALDLQELDDEIDHTRRTMKYETEKEDQVRSLAERRAHLQSLKEAHARRATAKATRQATPPPAATVTKNKGSPASSQLSCGIKEEWQDMKLDGAANEALDQLMELIGLESVKEEFLSVKSSIDLKIRQGLSLAEERLSCSLLGNPGTGKTTVARLWARFLATIGAISGSAFMETTGAKLASDGVKGCEALLEDIKNAGGGVLFIDEAYQLSSGNSTGGKAVLDYLLAEIENLRGKVAFVLAGYNKEMESFFSHNPGIPSRFPIAMSFDDYSDAELLAIFQRQLHRKFRGTIAIEDGPAGLYARVFARRVGRGRGKRGFGNARAVENAFDKMLKRQANRLRKERRAGIKNDELVLTMVDVIGPEPSHALDKCPAWGQLNNLIGLEKVKQQLKVFRDVVVTNYHRELAEEPTIDFTLNRVFVGSPGTGKTTVAKLYGQILSHLGLLSDGEVVVKNPSDFVGAHLGHSEAQTKGILAATIGKVLVIDEAYGLYDKNHSADSFKTAVIDTIVADVQSVPGDDRCVLLLGYQGLMEDMFQNVNPGLSRRFPMSSAFDFEDFDEAAMAQILDLKLKQAAFKATGRAKVVAMDILNRARNRPNFGNAGEVDILLNRAKESYQKRMSNSHGSKGYLDPEDFDADFDRSMRDTNVAELFKDDVDRDEIILLLEGYQTRVRELKGLGMDPKEEIPFSFLFRGPPGTGKTTTARKMGKVYYDMGFLASDEVIECSATDLIGQYVGHTGPKVQQLLDKALGRVLFIDEAYRLAGGSTHGGASFAKEAVDELVDCVTKTRYQGKLIIILAGYVQDINTLLSINPGLSSRFPETVDFVPLATSQCINLFVKLLSAKKDQIAEKGKVLDISCLVAPSQEFHQKLTAMFDQLAAQEGWASARDVKQLSKSIFRAIPLSGEMLCLREAVIEAELQKMFQERAGRMAQRLTRHATDPLAQHLTNGLAPGQRPASTCTPSHISTEAQHVDPRAEDKGDDNPSPDEPSSGPPEAKPRVAVRDAGVSDEIWHQLEKDKAAVQEREAEYRKLKEAQRSAQGAARDRIIRQLIEEDEQRKREAATRAKLKAMGKCPVGYEWIKQHGGYRCAGGSHWLDNGQIDSL